MSNYYPFFNKPKDWLVLLSINTLIAIMLTMVGDHKFISNFIFSQCIGIFIAAVVTLSTHSLKYTVPTLGVFIFSIPIGVFLGVFFGAFVVQQVMGLDILENGNFDSIISLLTFSLFSGVIVSFYFTQRALKEKIEKKLIKEELKKQESQSALINTELKLLQAQIEPHFLFNTLSNVISLIESEPKTAKTMLQSLTQYLRVGLNRTRDMDATVADEVTLLGSYLSIQKIRMGERLRYTLKAEDDTLALMLPPLLIQPLVENALKHGIEKQVEGGIIDVVFYKKLNQLIIEIKDSGYGMQTSTEKNITDSIGLKNVEQRLKSIYGAKASMKIMENKPTGLFVQLTAPIGKIST